MISGCTSNSGSAECCKVVQECAGPTPPPPDTPDRLPDTTVATGQQACTAIISPFQISAEFKHRPVHERQEHVDGQRRDQGPEARAHGQRLVKHGEGHRTRCPMAGSMTRVRRRGGRKRGMLLSRMEEPERGLGERHGRERKCRQRGQVFPLRRIRRIARCCHSRRRN